MDNADPERHRTRQRVRVDPGESPAVENTDDGEERDTRFTRRARTHWFTPPLRAKRELR